MSATPGRTLARFNRLISLQQKLKFYEQSSDFYKQGLDSFKLYLECVREFNKPREMVNGYIRMAKYCERMEDVLLSRDLYKEAVEMMITFQVGTEGHVRNLRHKIQALNYFY
ncbi:MAG: hypothetical protein ACTSRK_14885 [Promethearchaeota archaeon]